MFYLKYRPQTVSQLDNSHVRETLGKSLLANRWVHAYLFVGPRGTGKTSTARILAKVVNCPNRKKGEEPCNRCDACKSIAAGNSLDVIEIDGASNTGVEDIRNLREKVKLAPTTSKYKVYIIDEVHMLSTSAFNALLKTLEEPPEHVIFVLATTDPHKLPQTVISRCLVYDFGHVGGEDLQASLRRVVKGEKLVVDKEVLAAVAGQSGNSFRDAQKILEQLAMQSAKLDLAHLDNLKFNKIEDVSKELLDLLSKRQQTECLRLVENFAESNQEKLKDLTNELISKLRDILLSKFGVSDLSGNSEISVAEVNTLVWKLVEANNLLRDCPVPQLPLELVIVEFCSSQNSPVKTDVTDAAVTTEFPDKQGKSKKSVTSAKSDITDDTWAEVLVAVKPLNHSLVALLRASRPGEMRDGWLTVEVFYKFHKERLEEPKNREVLEKVVSGIIKKDLKVKFVLAERGEK